MSKENSWVAVTLRDPHDVAVDVAREALVLDAAHSRQSMNAVIAREQHIAFALLRADAEIRMLQAQVRTLGGAPAFDRHDFALATRS